MIIKEIQAWVDENLQNSGIMIKAIRSHHSDQIERHYHSFVGKGEEFHFELIRSVSSESSTNPYMLIGAGVNEEVLQMFEKEKYAKWFDLKLIGDKLILENMIKIANELKLGLGRKGLHVKDVTVISHGDKRFRLHLEQLDLDIDLREAKRLIGASDLRNYGLEVAPIGESIGI